MVISSTTCLMPSSLLSFRLRTRGRTPYINKIYLFTLASDMGDIDDSAVANDCHGHDYSAVYAEYRRGLSTNYIVRRKEAWGEVGR